ncbi:MAG: hypothetical protein P8Y03_29700 [Anaerolineales bacterium]
MTRQALKSPLGVDERPELMGTALSHCPRTFPQDSTWVLVLG